MNSRDIVAIILAIAVLSFVLTGTALRQLIIGAEAPHPPEYVVSAWQDVVNVLIGALAGYIAGRNGGRS